MKKMKLIMNWDVKPAREHDYMLFVSQVFIPEATKLGLQLTDAWYTVAGEGPQILMAGVADNLAALEAILESEEWGTLMEHLRDYIANFQSKIVRSTERFQI